MQHLWLSQYPPNVAHTIDPSIYPSLVDLLNASCKNNADRTAYQHLGSTLSYAQLDLLSCNLACYLQEKLTPGAHVAIMMPNGLASPVTLFAILRAGCVVVNTNPLYTRDELVHQLRDSGVTAIIAIAHVAEVITAALPDVPLLKHVILHEFGDLFSPIKRCLFNFICKHIKPGIKPYNLPTAVKFRNALKYGSQLSLKPANIRPEDLAFLQYTGGTTGVSKGAMLSHKNMVANVLQTAAWIAPVLNTHKSKQEIIITALPLYHIFSLTANCLLFLHLGAKNILITDPRATKQMIKQIKHQKFTAITGVSTLFASLLHHSNFKDIDLSELKMALAGGMSLPKQLAGLWFETTKVQLTEAYGLTEASPAVSINQVQANINKIEPSDLDRECIGLPLPSTEIAIRDPKGIDLPVGSAGELCVRGPQVMSGYWHRKNETDEIFYSDLFLRTGDCALMNHQGFLFLIDRIKDMIIVSGFNVYPNEIERVIAQMPQVLEVAVVGVETPDGNEHVKACIVKRDQLLTKAQVLTHARKHLTGYKIPRRVEFYNELPKSAVGKILRRELKTL